MRVRTVGFGAVFVPGLFVPFLAGFWVLPGFCGPFSGVFGCFGGFCGPPFWFRFSLAIKDHGCHLDGIMLCPGWLITTADTLHII